MPIADIENGQIFTRHPQSFKKGGREGNWAIKTPFDVMLDYGLIKNTLERKCVAKHIAFTCVDDFFQPITMAEIHKTWAIWLNPLVTTLPEVHTVMADIRPTLARFL